MYSDIRQLSAAEEADLCKYELEINKCRHSCGKKQKGDCTTENPFGD
jgi:hypothetical protein